MDDEIWLPIPGCNKEYSVSNLGRVRSELPVILRRSGAHAKSTKSTLKPSISKSHGYVVVNIARYGKRQPYLVHRLVAETFLGPCPEGMECAHKDGNRANPSLANLRWATPKQNNSDKVAHGTHLSGSKIANSKLSDEDVAAIRSDRRSQKLIAADFSISQSQVSRIKSGAVWLTSTLRDRSEPQGAKPSRL